MTDRLDVLSLQASNLSPESQAAIYIAAATRLFPGDDALQVEVMREVIRNKKLDLAKVSALVSQVQFGEAITDIPRAVQEAAAHKGAVVTPIGQLHNHYQCFYAAWIPN